MNNQYIYMVKVCTKCSYNANYDIPDLGEERTIGYISDFDKAKNLVENNTSDIWEYCYDYAIIEEIEEGFYPHANKRLLYKFNIAADKYELVSTPKFLKSWGTLTF